LRILYLINHAGNGGSEKYVKVLSEGLKNVEIFFGYNETGLLVSQMESLGAKVFNVKMKSPFDLKAAKQIAVICKENEIDIIHAQFPRENYIAILSKLYGNRAKVVYTSHINVNNNLVWKIMNFLITRKNSAVIAVCNSVKHLLISNNYPQDKIHVIFNGVGYEDYEGNNIEDTPFIFVVLARLSAEKGILFLLESIKTLSTETNKPFKLLLAGEGPLEAEAKNYVTENNLSEFVDFLGYTTNPKEVLSTGHVFINSSESEALSFAILEAMTMGLPVIATNVGGNPDIINDSTNCGILVAYNNPSEMATAMKTMMEDKDLYAKFSKNSRFAIKNTFDIKIMISKTQKMYKDILKD